MSGTRGGQYYSAGVGLQDMSVIADGGGHSWALHVCAHPGDQGTATPMLACLNVVDDAQSPGDGVGLPPATGGQLLYVLNRTGNPISVYPAANSSDVVAMGDGTTAPVATLPPTTTAMFVSIPGVWAIASSPPPTGGGAVTEAPTDGAAYVRSMQAWVNADTRYTTPAQAASAAPVQSVATRVGDVVLTHGDLSDWTSATSGFYLTSNPASYITLPQARAGVADGSAAAAGQIGEFQSVQRLSTAPLSLTNNADAVIASLSLTAGDWDIWGSAGFTFSPNVTGTLKAWFNVGGATAPSVDQLGGNATGTVSPNPSQAIVPITGMRVSITATTAVALGASPSFSNGSVTAWGKILARRMR
jgi:hypothetical protein